MELQLDTHEEQPDFHKVTMHQELRNQRAATSGEFRGRFNTQKYSRYSWSKRSNFQKALKTKTEIDVNAFQRGRCSPSPGFTQKPGCESLPWGPGQEQGRIPSSDGAAGLSPDITGFLCSQAQWGSWHCWFYIPLCWDVLGPCLAHGKEKHLFHFYQLLKIQLQKHILKLCLLSFINHMNHQVKRSWEVLWWH